MKILLGTQNRGKLRELIDMLQHHQHIEWLTFDDVPFSDVVEDGKTFRENALKKAREISQECNVAVLAEDSGLEVDALGGEPGVLTARYAGEHGNTEANNAKLLSTLQNIENRTARFVCVAALIVPSAGEWTAQGALEGQIAMRPTGSQGFGYDPIFIPNGYSETLAELGDEIKNGMSHRKQAIQGLNEAIASFKS